VARVAIDSLYGFHDVRQLVDQAPRVTGHTGRA
jgi:hypothetical protein